MSSDTGAPPDSAAPDKPPRGRRSQTGVRTLVALIACCGLILWAWRYLAENGDPVRLETRAIQKRAIQSLQSDMPGERVAAIQDLERLHSGDSSSAVPPLIGALADQDASVRLAAAEALGSMGQWLEKSDWGKEALNASAMALIGCLKDPDIAVRVAAIRNLSSTCASLVKSVSGEKALCAAATALTECLKDPDPGVRSAAASSLAECVSLASSATGAQVLGAAATALTECLKDPNPGVRSAAASSLAQCADLASSAAGAQALGAAATALIACVKDPEPGVRSAAAFSLRWVDSPNLARATNRPIDRKTVMSALGALVHDPNADVRLAAINTLASRRTERGELPAILAEGLKDESAKNRARTIQLVSLERKGLDYWVPLLLDLAVPDPDPTVQYECLLILSNVCRPPAITAAVVPALISRLKSRDARVRLYAASLLCYLGADALAAVPELLRVINEPLDLHGEAAIRPRNMNNPDPATAAAWALGHIAPGSAEEKKVIAALMEVVRSGPVSRRGWAAVALGEFREVPQEAVPILIKLLSEAASNDEFEGASLAAQALGKIAPETSSADQALASLLTALDSRNDDVQITTIEALGRFGPKAAAAIPRIRALKGSVSGRIKNAATKALAAIEAQSGP